MLTYDRKTTLCCSCSKGPGPDHMAIGEFGGAARCPAMAGRCWRRRCTGSTKWATPRSIPSRAFADADAAVLQESGQSARAHHLRQVDRRGAGIVRALDAPLRPAGMGHRLHHRRRRDACRSHHDGLGASVLPAAAFRARVRARAAPAAAEAADRRADVGPLRDAAARHGRSLPAEPRCLHHRMGRRAHGAAAGGPLRSRRLHRLRHLHAAHARRRHACHRGMPALGAGDGRDCADGSRQRSLRTALDGADGWTDRHAHQSQRRQQACRAARRRTGSATTSLPRCRSRILASCATSIRASCNCTGSSA